MSAAAFRACYADFKLVKTRGVVQLIFEVPLHEADLAYQVVGGMPDAAAERWFAIARLKPEGDDANTGSLPEHKTVPASEDSTTPARARKSWHEMPASQQAGVLCGEKAFQKFLGEAYGYNNLSTADAAARVVRELCHIDSRADLSKPGWPAEKWRAITSMYRAWQREPEVIG